MTTDMLRLAGEIEGGRAEAFAGGEIDESRRRLGALASVAPAPGSRAPDFRALVMRAVVPRLAENLRMRAGTAPASRAGAAPLRGEEDGSLVGELIDHLLRDDLAGLFRTIEAVRAGGLPLERIYLDLLAPAAAAVARLVDSDGCSTATGTLAFCNLQLVLRRYADAFYGEGQAAHRDRERRLRGSRALLVPTRAMGGLSAFGLPLAADFLRRAGWDAWIEPSFRSASFRATVDGRWFDLIQVLAAEDDRDEALVADEMRDAAAGIRAIRRDGANPRVVVVACGSAFARDPALAAQLGADHAGADPLSALRFCDRWSEDIPNTQARRRRHLS